MVVRYASDANVWIGVTVTANTPEEGIALLKKVDPIDELRAILQEAGATHISVGEGNPPDWMYISNLNTGQGDHIKGLVGEHDDAELLAILEAEDA